MTYLTNLERGWDEAAREDAFFNILTIPGKQGNWTEEEFFAHGQQEIDSVIERLDRLGLRMRGRTIALDFGCGVGRLTQALGKHYAIVEGVDVSKEMIDQARKYADGKRWANFYVNTESNLKLFKDGRYDLIYSVITLQHMPNRLQRCYIYEFVRVLAKSGLAVFQLPEGPEYQHPNPWLSMYGATRDTVTAWVAEADGEVLDIELTNHSGGGYLGWRYTVRRAR